MGGDSDAGKKAVCSGSNNRKRKNMKNILKCGLLFLWAALFFALKQINVWVEMQAAQTYMVQARMLWPLAMALVLAVMLFVWQRLVGAGPGRGFCPWSLAGGVVCILLALAQLAATPPALYAFCGVHMLLRAFGR